MCIRKFSHIFVVVSVLLFSFSSVLVKADESLVEVDNFWVREVPAVSSVTAAFGILRAKEKTELVSVTANISETVEIHNSVSEDGVMRMKKLNGIALPADAEFELAPGGYHIMFIDLKKALKKGDVVDMTLHFSSGQSVFVQAPVRSFSGTSSHMKK